jgi:hypothetical protein
MKGYRYIRYCSSEYGNLNLVTGTVRYLRNRYRNLINSVADPHHLDAYSDPVVSEVNTLMRIRILPFNMMRTHADPDLQHCLPSNYFYWRSCTLIFDFVPF